MGFLFPLFVLYIGGMFLFSFIASIKEVKKSQDRKSARGKKQPTGTSILTDVEQTWTKMKQLSKPKKDQKVVQKKQRNQRPKPSAEETSQSPAQIRAARQERLQKMRDQANKLDDEKRGIYRRKIETPYGSDQKNSSSVLTRSSLKQAMLTKEILDKPLSIRNRRTN